MTLHQTCRRAFVALATAAVFPMPVSAQRSVVFQHGINSDGQTWSVLQPALSAAFQISPWVPTTAASDRWADQANQLTSFIAGAPSNAIVLGHSNGGLISRVANMPAYGNRAWGGLITVGSAHGGGPLADRILDGSVATWFGLLIGEPLEAINTYSYFSGWLGTAVSALNAFVQERFDLIVGLSGLGVYTAQPVVADMGTLSTQFGLLGDLNHASNLAREASAIPVRVGITSTVSSNAGLVWRSSFGADYQGKRNVQLTAAAVFYGLWGYYAFYEDSLNPAQAATFRDNAHLWLDAGHITYFMDDDWCYLIGAEISYHNCGPSDALVPAERQTYQGASETRFISGPSHVEETKSPQLDAAMRALLADVFQVEPIPGGGSGGGGWIVGPSFLLVNEPGTWTTSTGATTCDWWVDTQIIVSNGSCSFTYSFSYAPQTYQVSVNADGNSLDPLSVEVNQSGCEPPECYDTMIIPAHPGPADSLRKRPTDRKPTSWSTVQRRRPGG